MEYAFLLLDKRILAAQVNENNVLQASKRIKGENDAILERKVIDSRKDYPRAGKSNTFPRFNIPFLWLPTLPKVKLALCTFRSK